MHLASIFSFFFTMLSTKSQDKFKFLIHICNTRHYCSSFHYGWKALLEKMKMSVFSIFTFSSNIFLPSQKNNQQYFSYIVATSTPTHAFLDFFNQYSVQYSFQDTGCTIINPRKEYWQSRGSDQQPPVLKSSVLPNELWGLEE